MKRFGAAASGVFAQGTLLIMLSLCVTVFSEDNSTVLPMVFGGIGLYCLTAIVLYLAVPSSQKKRQA